MKIIFSLNRKLLTNQIIDKKMSYLYEHDKIFVNFCSTFLKKLSFLNCDNFDIL